MESLQSILSKLNYWPEYLRPGERRFSNLFAECIAGLARSPDDRDTLPGIFNAVVQQLGAIWAPPMLVKFSKQCSAEPATQRLQDIARVWNELEPDKKADISGRLTLEPIQEIESVAGFLRGEIPFFAAAPQFPCGAIRFPFLLPYTKYVDSLLLYIRQVRELVRHLNLTDDFQEIGDAFRKEKDRIIEMSGVLMDSATETTKKHIADGEVLLKQLKTPFAPGRINPHLLFRYASERGWLENLLVRKGGGINEEKIPTTDSAAGE